jgi:hypothetical protein
MRAIVNAADLRTDNQKLITDFGSFELTEGTNRQELHGTKGKGRDIGYALAASSCEEA